MSNFKEETIYPFLKELKAYKSIIKKEVINIEQSISNQEKHVAIPKYPNKYSTIYENKGWSPQFQFVVQGYSFGDFLRKYQFIPESLEADSREIDNYESRLTAYMNYNLPETTNILKNFFKDNNKTIISMHMFRLEGGGSGLPLHINYDPYMYRCHFGILVPEGDIGLLVAGEIRKWKEGEFLIFDSMQPHMVWNRTNATRYIINIDCYRPEPELDEIKTVHQSLVDLRMKKNKFSYGYSGGTGTLNPSDHLKYDHMLSN